MRRWSFLLASLAVAALGAAPLDAASADRAEIRKAYERALEEGDLEDPRVQRRLAAWCTKHGLEEEGARHERRYRELEFAKRAARYLEGEPDRDDWERILRLAERYEVEARIREARRSLARIEYEERRASLGDDDLEGWKGLLDWADEQGYADGADTAARKVLSLAPDDPDANRRLGRIEVDGEWSDPWERLVADGGLEDVAVRYEIHRLVAEVAPESEREYRPDPYAEFETHRVFLNLDFMRSPFVEVPGESEDAPVDYAYWVRLPDGYTPEKRWPVIVALHGGGSGDYGFSRSAARNAIASYHKVDRREDHPYIVIAPAAPVHCKNSWNIRGNMLSVIDAILDLERRCPIDRRRIYLHGASMGAQGVSRFSWVVPECFAAFCAEAGAYWNDHPVPDLTGKDFLVLHGEKDAGFRNKSLKVFLEKIREANAGVEYVSFPDQGHSIDSVEHIFPRLFPFFEARTNPITPDLGLVRRVIAETVDEKPR